jgi:hypothetical protein
MRFLIATLLLASSLGASADQWVRGYTRQNGTYVQPHVRSNSDGYNWNNYSTRGNTNPYTGERGYRSGYEDGWKPLRSRGSDSIWDD